MGFSIQASGEAVFTRGEDQLRISSSSLQEVDHFKNSSQISKADDEEWLVSFSVVTEEGQFVWTVSYSSGLSGVLIDHTELVNSPASLELTEDMDFEVVEVND